MRTNPIDKTSRGTPIQHGTSRGTPTHAAPSQRLQQEQEIDVRAMHEKAFPAQDNIEKTSPEAQQAIQKTQEIQAEVAAFRAQVERQIADLNTKLSTIAGMAAQGQDSDDPLDKLTGTPSVGIKRIADQIQLEAFEYKGAFELYDESASSVYIRGGTKVFRYNGTSYDAYSPGTQITGITSTCFIYLAFTLATSAVSFAKAATVPVDSSTTIYVPLWYIPYASGQITWRNIIDLRGATIGSFLIKGTPTLYMQVTLREYDENGTIVAIGSESSPLATGHTLQATWDWTRAHA